MTWFKLQWDKTVHGDLKCVISICLSIYCYTIALWLYCMPCRSGWSRIFFISGKSVLLHPCFTYSRKSTISKTPSKKVVKIEVPKQRRPWNPPPHAVEAKISSQSKFSSNPKQPGTTWNYYSRGNSHFQRAMNSFICPIIILVVTSFLNGPETLGTAIQGNLFWDIESDTKTTHLVIQIFVKISLVFDITTNDFGDELLEPPTKQQKISDTTEGRWWWCCLMVRNMKDVETTPKTVLLTLFGLTKRVSYVEKQRLTCYPSC